MNNIELTSKNILTTSTSSKGNQNKWHTGDYWIKEDYLGYESLSETVASRLAIALNFPYKVTEYYPKAFTVKYRTARCCVSKDFSENLQVITLYRLFQLIFPDIDLINMMHKRNLSTIDRIEFVINHLTQIPHAFNILHYITAMCEFDALIYNEDRHLNNIIFLYDGKLIYPAPLFDCGAGFISDTYNYSLDIPIHKILSKINNSAKPFSKNFNKQVEALHTLTSPILNPDKNITLDISDITSYYSPVEIGRVYFILKMKFKNITIMKTGKLFR